MSLNVGAILRERYEIVRCIKSGGMGSVCEARDRHLANSPCAVKEILDVALLGPHADYIKSTFTKEMEALASLDHAAIPRVRDYFTEEDKSYIVMDFVQGRSLQEELEDGPFPPGKAAYDILCLLEVVEYLHGLQPPILHRDIKPANVVRDARSGRVKLVDFGLAKAFRETGSPQSQVGTIGYCALEQLTGNAEPRSDVYSVGAAFYHALTGKVPQPNFSEPLKPELPTVRPGLAEIVARATAPSPRERYPNAAAMAADLRVWLEGGCPTAPPPAVSSETPTLVGTAASAPRPPARGVPWAPVMVMGAVAASLLGARTLRTPPQAPATPTPIASASVASPTPDPLAAERAALAQEREELARRQKEHDEQVRQQRIRSQEEIVRNLNRPKLPPQVQEKVRQKLPLRPRLDSDEGPPAPRLAARRLQQGRPALPEASAAAPATENAPSNRAQLHRTYAFPPRTVQGHRQNVQVYAGLRAGDFSSASRALETLMSHPQTRSSWQRIDSGESWEGLSGMCLRMSGAAASGGYHVFFKGDQAYVCKIEISPPCQISTYDWNPLFNDLKKTEQHLLR